MMERVNLYLFCCFFIIIIALRLESCDAERNFRSVPIIRTKKSTTSDRSSSHENSHRSLSSLSAGLLLEQDKALLRPVRQQSGWMILGDNRYDDSSRPSLSINVNDRPTRYGQGWYDTGLPEFCRYPDSWRDPRCRDSARPKVTISKPDFTGTNQGQSTYSSDRNRAEGPTLTISRDERPLQHDRYAGSVNSGSVADHSNIPREYVRSAKKINDPIEEIITDFVDTAYEILDQ